MLYLVLAATQDPALPAFATIMVVLVLPLTAVTLAIVAARELHQRRARSTLVRPSDRR
ncbi:MAG: hypothetical protein M3O34_14320 [Chloroflexota bacterium]|nr:hypothetical protein [Chloroflexota bacterium]